KQHGKPIHYHELSKKISEIGKKDVTKQSVHNELIKNSDFILVGRGIYALADWGYTPGIVEEVIVTVLEEAGEPLHKDIIIGRVLERRIVKPSTIVLNLQKPRFKKIDKSVYTLN
ncbi:winged helix-turn-helix domain-containing protein, partial [Patescibacteria group bacterium]|nr:winged helix-turn-helix domain-containing protein [Patescibacteria group bacterium]